MKKLVSILIILALLCSFDVANAGPFSLKRKSMLEIKLSARDYRNNQYASTVLDRNSFENVNFSIGINHWTSENSAMTFSIAASEVNTGYYYNDFGVLGTKSSLVPIFWGTRLYMTDMNGVMPIKPYIALSGGPVIGINNYKDYGDVVYFEDDVYLTFGGYVGGGVDVMFGSKTSIGFQAGYNFYADFDRQIGDRKNFSGAEIGLSLGFLFGDNDNQERKRRHKKRVRKF